MLQREGVQIEHGAYEHYERYNYDNTAYNPVYKYYAAVVEYPAYLVHKPGKSEPPQHGSEYDAHITCAHFNRMVGHNKCQLRIARHKQEYYKWIGECDKKCRYAVLHQGAPAVVAYVYFLGRIAAVTVYSESQQHDAAAYL